MAMAAHRAARPLLSTEVAGLQAHLFTPYCPPGETAGHCLRPTPTAPWLSLDSLPRTDSKQSYQLEYPQPHIRRPPCGIQWFKEVRECCTTSINYFILGLKNSSQVQRLDMGRGIIVSEPGTSRKADWEKQSWRLKGPRLSKSHFPHAHSARVLTRWHVFVRRYVLAILQLGKQRGICDKQYQRQTVLQNDINVFF